jgi:glycine/D-amino acid oxidase-like deaminating enzyme
MKAVVIGAGIVGSGVAFRLAQAGAEVTVIEADRVGGGTSSISFAWTNANRKPPRAYHDLNVGGMKAHAALREEFGEAPWFHQHGCLEWAMRGDKSEQHAEKVEQLRSWGYAAEWITKDKLIEMEPDIDAKRVGDAEIAFYSEDGWIDPVVYANAMIKAAQSHGAVLRCGARVTGVETANSRVKGVRLQGGEVVAADMVVNCAGRWADRVAEDPGLKIPLAPTVGFLVFTPPVATSVKRPLLTPTVNLRPDGAGRLMMRTSDMDQKVSLDMEPSPTMAQALGVMKGAAELLPCLAGVKPEAARITARPIPKDGFSAVGPAPRMEGYYFVVTHSGVTLSPFLAKAVADEIMRGKIRPELETFRPERFFN